MTTPGLIPRPASVSWSDESFEATATTRIISPPQFDAPARLIRDHLERGGGFSLNIVDDTAGDDAIVFVHDPGLNAEAYRLSVTSSRVTIIAANRQGAQWGAQTFLQLLPPTVFRAATISSEPMRAQGVEIVDEPRFSWRGVMLDPVRHFIPPRDVRRYVDLLAMHKMNVLHLHLTDDQGWRVQILRYPELTARGAWRSSTQVGAGEGAGFEDRPHGGFYTQDDVREIVAYASARGITVVPEIELPGHARAALAAYPELGVTGEALEPWPEWGVCKDIFNVEERTIEFLCNVFDEIIELFPSEVICVGGDECPKGQWRSDPRTQERMRELGIDDEHELQSWFVGRINAHLNSRGRRLLGWDDILEGGLVPSASVLSWRGRVGAINAAAAGHDVIACPEDSVYLDYRQSSRADEPIPVGTITDLARVYAFDPVPVELSEKQRKHVLGGQANLWSEHIDSSRTLDYMMFPRLCALSEALWSTQDRDLGEFRKRLSGHLERLQAQSVEYRHDSGPLPWQTRPGIPGRPSTDEESAAHIARITANIR